jgi:hypothetical protein
MPVEEVFGQLDDVGGALAQRPRTPVAARSSIANSSASSSVSTIAAQFTGTNGPKRRDTLLKIGRAVVLFIGAATSAEALGAKNDIVWTVSLALIAAITPGGLRRGTNHLPPTASKRCEGKTPAPPGGLITLQE